MSKQTIGNLKPTIVIYLSNGHSVRTELTTKEYDKYFKGVYSSANYIIFKDIKVHTPTYKRTISYIKIKKEHIAYVTKEY
jgi:hypothetical protein